MSYIEPNSRIEFFTDLGLSQDYNDTLYFVSTAAKDAYFTDNNLPLAHVDRCYYTREHRGFVRVELPMSTLIHAQYMRFKNTSFENKWWYAFVTNVAYINNNTTEVQFELDPMMTWMGEFTLRQCFVERQHQEEDYIGVNTVPEPIKVQNYITRNRINTNACGLYMPVIFMSHKDSSWIDPSLTMELYQPQYVGGVYNALDMIYCGTAEAVEFVIDKLISENWIDDVVAIKMLPLNFKPLSGSVGENRLVTRNSAKPYTDIGGYTDIKNNKLFTYPYNYLSVSNSEGEENTFRYEWFGSPSSLPPNENTSPNYTFNFIGSWNVDTQIMCIPTPYKGISTPEYEERITMQDFPNSGWNVDMYKATMAQKESSLPTRLLASGMNAMAQEKITGSDFFTRRAVNEGVYSITDILANKILPPNMPTIVRGSQGSNTLMGQKVYDGVTQIGTEKDFIFTEINASYEDARILDNFFTMFGYAQNSVFTPNMHARQRFTYVKTKDCKIDCDCPASDADFIEGLINKGIRFWTNHTYIGDYSTANLPLS